MDQLWYKYRSKYKTTVKSKVFKQLYPIEGWDIKGKTQSSKWQIHWSVLFTSQSSKVFKLIRKRELFTLYRITSKFHVSSNNGGSSNSNYGLIPHTWPQNLCCVYIQVELHNLKTINIYFHTICRPALWQRWNHSSPILFSFFK